MVRTARGHVLVLDDQEVYRRILLRIFSEKEGHQVYLCECGDQALELIRMHPIQVVIFDFNLKGRETGLEVAQRVLQLFPERVEQMHIVIFTSAPESVQDELEQRAVPEELREWVAGRVIDKCDSKGLRETVSSLLT